MGGIRARSPSLVIEVAGPNPT
uniref:Uncharacterized protein n=1 Tax=Arundo donax TaxID=35708 RepID=A0A0A9GMC3_ARUDO